jgi:group I intron endonuclease
MIYSLSWILTKKLLPLILNILMVNHNKITKNAGVYKFTCLENGKVYIGKSVNIYNRVKQHKTCKGLGYFQRAIIKYGWKSFDIEVIEVFENFDKFKDNENLLQRESYYIDLFDSTNRTKGYNICKYSTDRTGLEVSVETKEKMRLAKLGTKFSDELKEKLSQIRLSNPMSEDQREKLLQSKLGKPRSNDTKDKIRKYRIGKKHSEETKEKMRQARLANLPSEEQMEKLRQSNIGRKHSKEHIEKRRQANLGQKRSEEAKERMRQGKLKLTNQNQ